VSNLVMDKKFVCTEGDGNHNKFWNVKVYSDGILETVYGRVGDSGGSTRKDFGSEDSAIREAEKMIRKKERGKNKNGARVSVYQEVEIVGTVSANNNSKKSVGKSAWKAIAQGDSEVESLIAMFDKENVHNITSGTSLTYDETTGLFSTPLGVVGQNSIDEARTVLSEIKSFVEKKKFTKEADRLAEKFMMIIPQNIGRTRPTLKTICPTLDKLDEHNSILDSLQASLDIVLAPKDDDSKDDTVDFGVTLSVLNDKKEFDRVNKFFGKTRQSKHVCHHLNMQKIFVVDHKTMSADFEKSGKSIGNVMELWHGTRVGNILSILAKGMYIPPSSASHCTGRMFGNGVYFSDQSTKSLNYSYGYWSGKSSNHCFMFLFDVAMGKSYTPSSYGGRNLPKSGYDSTFAKAGQSGVMNNEMIVYKTYQCCPKYLIEFK